MNDRWRGDQDNQVAQSSVGHSLPPRQYRGEPIQQLAPGRDALSITGMYLSLGAILGSWIPVVNLLSVMLAIAGLVCSIIGLVKVQKSRKNGKGMAIAGIILAILTFAIAIVAWIFFLNWGRDLEENLNNSLREDWPADETPSGMETKDRQETFQAGKAASADIQSMAAYISAVRQALDETETESETAVLDPEGRFPTGLGLAVYRETVFKPTTAESYQATSSYYDHGVTQHVPGAVSDQAPDVNNVHIFNQVRCKETDSRAIVRPDAGFYFYQPDNFEIVDNDPLAFVIIYNLGGADYRCFNSGSGVTINLDDPPLRGEI